MLEGKINLLIDKVDELQADKKKQKTPKLLKTFDESDANFSQSNVLVSLNGTTKERLCDINASAFYEALKIKQIELSEPIFVEGHGDLTTLLMPDLKDAWKHIGKTREFIKIVADRMFSPEIQLRKKFSIAGRKTLREILDADILEIFKKVVNYYEVVLLANSEAAFVDGLAAINQGQLIV